MAKLDRKDVKIFAENSKETLITEFRTEDSAGMTASFSRDPDVIQNENYSQGWVNDTNNLNTKIYGEDLNAVNYVLSYLLKYLYENGIAEWKSTTTYYQNSICKVDNALYLSLQNNNIGNDPTSTVSYWKLIPLENVSIEDAGSGFSIVKDVTDNVITFKTISVTGYGEITDNGDQLNIDIAGGGGGGGGDTYWGTIKGTITNQTDLISLINLKQDIFTVDSPLVLTDEQHLTINKATSSVSGYLDYNDFNTFNGKQNSLSFSTPLSETSGTVSIAKSDTSTSGYLDYQDWNTFNGKQDNIQGVDFYYDSSIIKQEPDSDRTSYMGSPSHPYSYVYSGQIGDNTHPVTDTYNTNITSTNITTTNIKTDNYKNNLNYTNPTTPFTNFNFGSTYYYDNGTNNEMSILNIQSSYDIDTNTFTEILPQKINSEIHNCNLGSDTQRFWRGYFVNLNTTGSVTTPTLYTQSIEPTSGNTTVTIANPRIGTIRATTNGGTISITDKVEISGAELKILNGEGIRFGYSYLDFLDDNKYTVGNGSRKAKAMYSYSYQGSSDIRNKENINPYNENVLDKIDKITPITYTFKNGDKDDVRIGISAQELKEQEPLCVKGLDTKGEDSSLTIDLMELIVFNMKAIKELNAKVKTLEKEVAELKGQTK